MSYYHRDNKGNWFVKNGDKLYPVELSASMEIAYQMGALAGLKEVIEAAHENLMQTRDSQIP